MGPTDSLSGRAIDGERRFFPLLVVLVCRCLIRCLGFCGGESSLDVSDGGVGGWDCGGESGGSRIIF